MRERLRGSIGVLLALAFVAAILPVCPCVPEAPGGEHACCAPVLSLTAADGGCCPPSLTIEGVAGISFAPAGPAEAPGPAAAPALPLHGGSALAVAAPFAPSPPAILRI